MFGLNKKRRLRFNDPLNIIGKRGVVSITIKPYHKGQIAVNGTWYSAICERDIILAENEIVEVINIEGNTVYVKPFFKN